MLNIILYIFLVIIVIFYQNSKVNYKFLNKEEAKSIFESDEYKLYESLFQVNEVKYKSSGRIIDGDTGKLKQLYLDSIFLPSKENENQIVRLLPKANEILFDKIGTTIYWKFCCFRNNLDWNFYFTIDSVIFIPEYELNKMMKMKDSYTLAFLVHEAMHILQKGELKNEFDRLYYKMNFVKKDVREKLMKNQFIKDNWITNPDGLNGEWLYKVNDGYIAPLLLLDNGGSHTTKYIKLDKDFNVIDNLDNLENCQEYKKFTHHKINQNDHPNEIFGSYLQYITNNV